MEIIKHFGQYSIIRANYVQMTGDVCAAQLLSAIEEWSYEKLFSIGLNLAEVWLEIHVDKLVGCVLGAFGRSKVLASFECLVHEGWIEQRPSEDPFGWTFICRLNVEKVQKALDEIRRQAGGAV